MNFSQEYSDILLPFVENYKNAKNEKERKAVVQKAADAVAESSNLREGEGVALPSDLQKVLYFFILNSHADF